jgi:transposase InsO family protein
MRGARQSGEHRPAPEGGRRSLQHHHEQSADVASESPDAELRRLRRENRELQMGCENLKKRRASPAPHPGTIRADSDPEEGSSHHAVVRGYGGDLQRLSRLGRWPAQCPRAARRHLASQTAGRLRRLPSELCYPRLTVELREQREPVGKARVARLMREEGLCGLPLKRNRPQTISGNHDGPIAPNRLAEIESITARDQVWQTDITYLPTPAGWPYLAVVIDAYNKRVIGWAFAASLATDFGITALLVAVQRRGGRCAPGQLLPSDRGVQYASERFRAELAAHGITASMSPMRQLLGPSPGRVLLSDPQNRTPRPPSLRRP